MQGVESRPDEQVQDDQRGQLVEAADETLWRQPPQAEQCKPAPQIPEQSGAQVGFYGARGQLRVLRSRSMSFSCSVRRTSSASASAWSI
jgi:hypothetical protein